MPLTAKGEKIMAAMKEKYGSERGEEVFYRSKNAGTIEGVDAGETERNAEGLREQLRAAQEGMSTARTASAKASYKAECDKLTAKIADMEKTDAMGHHVAGHVGKGGSQPKSIKHDDTPLARAEAAVADAIQADGFSYAKGVPGASVSPFKNKPGNEERVARSRELLKEEAERKAKEKSKEKRGDANVEIKKMADGRWGVFAKGDATKAAGQDSPLEKLESEIEEMKLHNKLGDALMKLCDMLGEKMDEFDGYVSAGEATEAAAGDV